MLRAYLHFLAFIPKKLSQYIVKKIIIEDLFFHSVLHTSYPDSTNAVGVNQRRYKKTSWQKRVSTRFSLFGRQWPELIFLSIFIGRKATVLLLEEAIYSQLSITKKKKKKKKTTLKWLFTVNCH